MIGRNRQWLLRRRPRGPVVADDFEYVEAPIPAFDELAPGELILRNLVFLCAPGMRNWMDPPGNSFYPSLPLGAPVKTPAACEVVASARPDVPAGTRVTSFTSWQDYERVGAGHSVTQIPDDVDTLDAIGVLGPNTLTAYFGMLRVGRPVAGENVVVSGAAGSTGSMAAQIAKIAGCRVIGIAGGPRKCAWLTRELGLDGAIDYKAGNVEDRLRELCPSGINVFFDNVGGSVLQAAVEVMARKGRIVLCGQIAGYNDPAPAPGPRNMMRLIYGGITMQGFLRADYANEDPRALQELRGWLAGGQLRGRVDARRGFADIPRTFASLFEGGNEGTLLAVVDT
jgi:NADPH-dependent curcumin reductase CurA